MPPLCNTPAEVKSGILAFNDHLDNINKLARAEAADLLGALSRARQWVAIQDANGKWRAAFVKFVGYKGQTPTTYHNHRVNMSGTDADRAVRKMGGHHYDVGQLGVTGQGAHPAVKAVTDLCHRFNRQPNASSVVLVMKGEDVPQHERQKVEMLLAAMKAAKLSKQAVADFFEKAKAA